MSKNSSDKSKLKKEEVILVYCLTLGKSWHQTFFLKYNTKITSIFILCVYVCGVVCVHVHVHMCMYGHMHVHRCSHAHARCRAYCFR